MTGKMAESLQTTDGLYVAVHYSDGVEKAMICDASSKQKVIKNILELYEPLSDRTRVFELDIYNVTEHRELYDDITATSVAKHTVDHDGGAERIHRDTYTIHPISKLCTGENKLDHRYKFNEMTRDEKDRCVFKETCMDCDLEKTTVMGLETDYGNAYYSIDYVDGTTE